jgi:transposase
MGLTQLLFPGIARVRVERVWRECQHEEREGGTRHILHMAVTTRRTRARCPCCGRRSRRVQSRYVRTIADVPCGGEVVTLHLHVCRFWCRVRWCRRRIFCERVPELVAPWARRTLRLHEHLRQEALRLGGEPAARHTAAAGAPVSARTLLRLVRPTPLPPAGRVRVLGVDDWSRRKGHDFGTILVNLESHDIIDLLPDRTAATLATWLGEHPEVEIVSRDRAGAYADGVRRGAPQAIQVADRFHLLKNLTELLERTLTRYHVTLRAAAQAAAAQPAAATRSMVVAQERTDCLVPAAGHGAAPPAPPTDLPIETANAMTPLSSPTPIARATTASPAASAAPAPTAASDMRPPTRAQQEHQARRSRRLAEYQEVLGLHAQGWNQQQIAGALGLGRKTVRRFLRADGFPERLPGPQRARTLDPYAPYLRERWAAGCDNALQLWRELQAQGYAGAASTVRQFLSRWRDHPSRPGKKGPRPLAGRGDAAGAAGPAAPPPKSHTYSARQTAWLLFKDEGVLTDDERRYVEQLRQGCPVLAQLQILARTFRELVRAHDVTAFARWLAEAEQSELPEVRGFAGGLRADRAAVEAGITLPWSQGQTEGQVNRLKTLKRAMYGRARFDLLRIRLLAAP